MPSFVQPASLPREPVARANAAAGAAIAYARTLQEHAAGLAATQTRCAAEERKNLGE